MTINSSLYQYLTTHSDVSDVIGDRMYPQMAPQAVARPYIVYNTISVDNAFHHGGDAGIAERRLQLDLYGDDALVLDNLAETLRLRLHGLRGFIGTTVRTDVRRITTQGPTSLPVAPSEGTELPLHRLTIDLIIWYRQPIASQ